MNDCLPEQSPVWQKVEQILRQVVASYGYSEVRMPIVEQTHLFKRAIGEVTDVVEKDMSHVAETSVIGELGIDSLAVLEIIGSMERSLRIRIPDEALTGVETVADLLAVVEARLATRTAP